MIFIWPITGGSLDPPCAIRTSHEMHNLRHAPVFIGRGGEYPVRAS